MNNNLSSMQLSGVVRPGEIYILQEDGSGLDDVELMYTIRADEEIIAALDMEVNIVCREYVTFQAFLGIEQISADTHLIKLLCYDKQYERAITLPYLLRRIKSFKEELASVKEDFGCA